jgi:general stress protein YciG
MDDSQERWREDLDTRNDMEQEFSNEETDVRGEIRTPRERATELVRKGGMPLFPGGRREWDKKRIITLITIPTTSTWPPTNWKSMSADQKYFNWEFASFLVPFSPSSRE